ncbi:MAG: ParB/RepB/Spo0J family partition protein [Solirubrobacteraceae bacterium]
MITTTPASGELRLALDDILVRENVRDLDVAHVDNLAQSIALRGLLVPLIVRLTGAGYELVAGYHRYHACRKLDLPDAPVVVREREGSSADSAAENVTRKQLTPLEEAKAVQAMLDEGYTLDGAAQALGWTRQLVTARAKILKLSEAGQQLVGAGEIPVSAIDVLLAVADVSPQIADAICTSIGAGAVAGSQLGNNAGWAIGQALRDGGKDTFGAYLNTVHPNDLKSLRLGKKTDALVAEAEKLHKQVDQYAYGPPTFRFDPSDTDQARAAGVLIELDGSNPIITDLALYRELAKQAIVRTVEQLRERAAAKASGKRTGASKRERTPREELDVEHRATLRELTRQAHGTNLDLGTQLLTELAAVAPDDMDVARFFALGLLGPESGNYLGTGDHVARTIAANGLRLVLDEHRATTTPTLKSGKPGKTKVAYGDVDVAAKWLWRFVDGAKTAGELYGRVLVVFAAQHYATQLVLANSQRRGSVLPRSHKDIARKAFGRVTKRVLPATHVRLQRALAAEARSHSAKIGELNKRSRGQRASEADGGDSVLGNDGQVADDD